MNLSAKTHYGIHALFDLAAHAHSGSVQVKDVAARQDLSVRYLEEVFHDLKRAGLVSAKRGPRGGYLLARPPETITLGDVVRALQGPISASFLGDDGTSREAASAKRVPSGQRVTATFLAEFALHAASWFDSVSLTDLIHRAQELGLAPNAEGPPMYFI